MGFKISPQDAYERAERQHDKFNRKNKTNHHREPTLEEQIRMMDELDALNRQKRIEAKKAEEEKKYFSPFYEAKFNVEQKEKNNEKNKG